MTPPLDQNKYEQLRASGELPSPRGVALAIIRLTQQEEVSIAELARVISGDPAFVGRVIKAANGLIAYNRRPVVSVQEALMVLGLPAVRSMALGFSLLSDYRNGGCRGFDYNGFWAFSLALALGMQMFAQRTRVAAPDELFSLGLLLRVGELALATLYPEEYRRVLDKVRETDADVFDLEREAFAMTRSELGFAMLSDWGLPAIFAGLVPQYERPDPAGLLEGGREYVLVHSLSGARHFAELCIAGESEQPGRIRRFLAQAERMGLDRDDLFADCRRMIRLWGEWGELLKLDMPAKVPFPELAPSDLEASDGMGVLARDLRRAFAVESGVDADLPSGDGVEAETSALRVLVVDEDPAVRARIVAAIREEGLEAHESERCDAGLERAVELEPRIMVVGCKAPGDESLNLIRALRRTRLGQSMYILLLSGVGGEEPMVQAIEAGVDDVVEKSAGPRVLAARLHAGLRDVRLQQELERDREELRRYAAELAVTNRQLQEVALTDTLTGLRNRRYAIDRMEQEWASAMRSSRPLSCMIIDFDRLKEINDSFGHDAGDLALQRAADALRNCLRGQDVICRIGGDEFLAICPGSGLDAAIACARRLCEAVARISLRVEGSPLSLSVSIGVAELDKTASDVDALMKLADQGAYLAKEGGRNAVAAVQRGDEAPDPGDRPSG